MITIENSQICNSNVMITIEKSLTNEETFKKSY